MDGSGLTFALAGTTTGVNLVWYNCSIYEDSEFRDIQWKGDSSILNVFWCNLSRREKGHRSLLGYANLPSVSYIQDTGRYSSLVLTSTWYAICFLLYGVTCCLYCNMFD
jgi:hypothetical protein